VNRPFGYGPALVGWRPTKLRSILTRTRRFGRPDLPLLSVNLPSGVVLRPEDSGRPAASEDLSGYQHVKPGDLVVNQLGKPHGALGVSWHEGIISPAYFVASIKPVAEPRFIHHLLRTRLYISEYERRGKFMPPNQFDISWDQFRDIELTLPPLALQRAIADYLDTETARIDALITKKQRVIALVGERVGSLIHEKVGSISTRRRLRQLASLGTGHTPDRRNSEYWENCSIAWVTAEDLSSRDNPFEALMDTCQKVSALGVANSAAVVHPAGTVMLCRTASIGLICRVGMPMATTQAFVTWSPGPELDSEFLMYALHSLRQEWTRLAFGSTHDTIYMPDLESVKIPYVPIRAQREIARELEVSTKQLLMAKQQLDRQCELLRERRQALITAAVTGELDVSGVAV